METTEGLERLREIADEIEELADEALGVVREVGTRHEVEYARGYWHPHIVTAVRNEHGYMGGSMGPLESTIESLANRAALRFPEGAAVVHRPSGREGVVVTPDQAAEDGDGPEVEVEVAFHDGRTEWAAVDALERSAG